MELPIPHLLTLPSEIIEYTVILSVSVPNFSSIGHLACTCRALHQLIYSSTGSQLWRQVFLTSFDDPRPLLRMLRGAGSYGKGRTDSGAFQDMSGFDWQGEFIRRIDSKRVMAQYHRLPPPPPRLSSNSKAGNRSVDMYGAKPLIMALRTILSVLSTASPFPADYDPFHSYASSEVLPPSVFVPKAAQSLVALFPSPSKNVAWVEEILEDGYPSILAQRYLFDPPNEGGTRKTKEEEEEEKLFYQLVFRKGFLPITPPSSNISSSSSPSSTPSSQANSTNHRMSSDFHDQYWLARRQAERKVYNIEYPMPDRSWGPFLSYSGATCHQVVSLPRTSSFAQASSSDGYVSEVIKGFNFWFAGPHVASRLIDSFLQTQSSFSTVPTKFGNDDDGEWVPEDEGDRDREDADEEDGELEEEQARPFLDFRLRHTTFTRKHSAEEGGFTLLYPGLHEREPDYSYLASARMFLEMYMMVQDDEDNAHLAGMLEFGRIPYGFWRGSSLVGVADERGSGGDGSEDGSEKIGRFKAQGNMKEGEEKSDVVGWDWAGAAGQWRRYVSWMGYRDLLRYNNHPNILGVDQNSRVFPMTLKIVGYSPPPIPKPDGASTSIPTAGEYELHDLVWNLPVIHVEGQSRGSDLDENDIRKIQGTVRMLRSGSVLWSLTSSYSDDDTAPEWQTEGIQVGGIGSAAGVIGMWTSADHSDTDPLGPTWMWKLG